MAKKKKITLKLNKKKEWVAEPKDELKPLNPLAANRWVTDTCTELVKVLSKRTKKLHPDQRWLLIGRAVNLLFVTRFAKAVASVTNEDGSLKD